MKEGIAMPLDHRAATERRKEIDAGGADPFVVVAGLIAAIPLGSWLLWMNGHEEIGDMHQFYGTPVTSSASLDTPA
jgi:hypothetical protein|tara:strand:+ start:31262 stop:31489 length:228 start_codon:yes stop_codon:yes gene_type:complete